MHPTSRRDGYFGYGYMWWVWDGPRAVGPFAGAYTGRGAIGQWITVLPALEGKAEKKMAYHHALMSFGSMVRRFIHSEQIKKSLCAWEKDKLIHQQHIDDCRKYEQVGTRPSKLVSCHGSNHQFGFNK